MMRSLSGENQGEMDGMDEGTVSCLIVYSANIRKIWTENIGNMINDK